ncbi:MAG: lysophospholipid acyltransferase (LPLAT)-like uncharacterized protein [Hyphomicrobiaceae bacterium]|jgi:lysophospholipid acyltransferase (LPLAT)-like uncharacterized protein
MPIFNKAFRSSGFIGLLSYIIIRIYSLTFRFTVEKEENWRKPFDDGESVLLVVWHQQFFAAIRHFKTYARFAPALMISRSKDGDVIADVAQRSGWYVARGSSSKGGSEALTEMFDRLNETHLAAHIADGPRGPAGRMKAGPVRLALEASAVIVPVYAVADRAWYLGGWDSFLLPKPFAKVTLRFGDAIWLEPSDDTGEFERQRLMVENVMRREGGYGDDVRLD